MASPPTPAAPPTRPPAQGFYDPAYEHDSCGVAFVADATGRRSHKVVEQGLKALCHMDHRGARGAEPNTGDGAGIMIQVPDEHCRAVAGVELPPAGGYATGLAFLPNDAEDAARARSVFEKYALVEGGRVLAWRGVPVDAGGLGASALYARPRIVQVFLAAERLTDGRPLRGIDLDRVAYCVRRQAERETRERGIDLHFPSLSSRTMTWKGMLTPDQLVTFYPDLS